MGISKKWSHEHTSDECVTCHVRDAADGTCQIACSPPNLLLSSLTFFSLPPPSPLFPHLLLPSVQVRDAADGTYELEWASTLAGAFPLDVMIDGAHVQAQRHHTHAAPTGPGAIPRAPCAPPSSLHHLRAPRAELAVPLCVGAWVPQVHGSPIIVTVLAASPAVDRFVPSGEGLSQAVMPTEPLTLIS